jgi:MEMO1 family protein
MFFLGSIYLSSVLLIQHAESNAEEQPHIRKPAVSGDIRGFYPSTPSKLKEMINGLLSNTEKHSLSGNPFALIVLHAGYVYSGQTAAWGFKQIDNLNPEIIFVIGSSHNWHYEGASVPDYSVYKTPLGSVPVNRKAIETLLKENPLIQRNIMFPANQSFFDKGTATSVHAVEHSLEVEIPFLQMIYKNFSIVPVLFGTKNLNACKSIGKTIGQFCKNNPGCIIVCSTDLTHYPPYESANSIDKITLGLITAMNIEKLDNFVKSFPMQNTPNLKTLSCGLPAVFCTLQAAKEYGANSAELINYSNSGDAKPPYTKKDSVVGYGSVLIYKSKKTE